MSDFRLWCRLCGDLDGSTEIKSKILNLIEQTLEINVDNIRICKECNAQLTLIDDLFNKARSLQRLFSGLEEETHADLTVPRLNAYREHFNLSEKISEVQYIEYKLEEESENEFEMIETVNFYENDEVIEEEYAEEIFLEADESMTSEDVVYENDIQQQQETISPQKKPRKVEGTEKSEEEKLFNFQCHLCSHPQFTNMKLLTIHCKAEHNCIPLVKCCSDECSVMLSTWRRLLIHKEKHFPDEEKLRCTFAGCNRTYISPVALEKHVESHNLRFICSHCGKDFKEAKTLKFHEEMHVKPIEARRNHVCIQPGCGLKFITKQTMENHYRVKHERILSFFCTEPNCDKGFFTKKGLYEHRRCHGNIRNYHCNICAFKSKTSSGLKIHEDVHKLGNSFSCDICNAGFPVLRRLKVHMISHSIETPFQCSYCDSAFKRRKDVRDHENIHTKERPNVCTFCPKAFPNAGNCRKHKVRDHPEELIAWEAENGIGGRKKLACYQ